MKLKNYYQILEIDPFVSQDAVKAAYVRLLKDHHPDRSGSSQTFAHKRFQAIMEAYEVLKTPEKRAAYDHMLKIQVASERRIVRASQSPRNDNKQKPKTTLLKWISSSFQQKKSSGDSLF